METYQFERLMAQLNTLNENMDIIKTLLLMRKEEEEQEYEGDEETEDIEKTPKVRKKITQLKVKEDA